MTFSIARKLGCSNSVAFLCGLMIALENMHIQESRAILMDAQLLFYCAASLWLVLKFWEREVRLVCIVLSNAETVGDGST